MVAPGVRGRLAGRLGARHRRAAAGRARGGHRGHHQVRRRRRPTWPRRVLFLGVVAWVTGHAGHAVRRQGDRRPGDLGSPGPGADRATAIWTRACRWTTAARSACSRPASTGWPTACASASASATCSAARWARTWRAPRSRGGTRLGGEEREIGALFVDIVGSTSMAMAMPPTEVVQLLNRFFRVVVEVVEAEGALVNKFEGDAALCVFGAPVPRDDPAGDALRAARELARRLAQRRARDRLRDRHLGRHRGGRQRGRRAPLRVHGDRRSR